MDKSTFSAESKPALTLIVNPDYEPPVQTEIITHVPTEEELVAQGFKRHLQVVREEDHI